MKAMKLFDLLPLTDWLALAAFFALWTGYALFARKGARSERTLLAATNRYRSRWILQATYRDPRMLDGLITQNLSHTPSFFCSTTILIIGGLLAVLGTTDKAAGLMQDIPFAQSTSMQVLELKLLVMTGIFVYAFFRFSWSMRLYTFVALSIGAMPPPEHFEAEPAQRQPYVERAATLVGTAAETFNDGLRAYYFSFAALAWFFSPMAMMGATVLVVAVLYSREFHSQVRAVLKD